MSEVWSETDHVRLSELRDHVERVRNYFLYRIPPGTKVAEDRDTWAIFYVAEELRPVKGMLDRTIMECQGSLDRQAIPPEPHDKAPFGGDGPCHCEAHIAYDIENKMQYCHDECPTGCPVWVRLGASG